MLPTEYDAKLVEELTTASRQQGDARHGLDVFCSKDSSCLSCHQVGKLGGALRRPSLTDVGRRLKPEEIAESLLWPRRQVKPDFSAWHFVLSDGRSLQGYKRGTAGGGPFLDATYQQILTIPADEIEAQREVGTLMPEGLAVAMTSNA